MLRVLQCVNNMHRAGLETMLMNYYRNVDRSRIQFDFLTHRPFRSDYDDEIESLGGKIYYAPRLIPQNYPSYFSYMKSFFTEHPEYVIVHSHIDAMSYLPLLAAKKANIPVRIAHSHNTAIDLDYKYPIKQFFRSNICKVATDYLACGKDAGRFLFNESCVNVIPNAIVADKFLYNDEIRAMMKKELSLDGRFVIGHVGRFSRQKNHCFLIDIFCEILKINPYSVLLLVGTGENEKKIRSRVDRLGISDRVQFLGVRSDVDKLYQVMDVFVLPSLFEGIPVVGIEAQFSDLSCFFSSRVPKEVAFSKKCTFIRDDLPAKDWAEQIMKKSGVQRGKEEYITSKYRIENAAPQFEQYYFNLLRARGLDV
ncbi:MAG: glycosyltransferase family 1 protein [Ruminococcaceae bacterium]|nr:glycosyltransferase family 1 protein [Oscillospiraceae bacterium]